MNFKSPVTDSFRRDLKQNFVKVYEDQSYLDTHAAYYIGCVKHRCLIMSSITKKYNKPIPSLKC